MSMEMEMERKEESPDLDEIPDDELKMRQQTHSDSSSARRLTFPMIKAVPMEWRGHKNSNSLQVTAREIRGSRIVTMVPDNSCDRNTGTETTLSRNMNPRISNGTASDPQTMNGSNAMMNVEEDEDQQDKIMRLWVAQGIVSRQKVVSMQQMRNFKKRNKMTTLGLNLGIKSM